MTGVASIPVDPSTSMTKFRWPLAAQRAWLIGSGPSFHTTHRWAIPEEFALDIVAVDATGSSHRGQGRHNADVYSYGADVVAAADGIVVSSLHGAKEDPPMLRQPGESTQAYYGRISERQAANFAPGPVGIDGDFVIIDHGHSEYSVYAHLLPGSIRVVVGDKVHAGQVIAKLGSSGNSTEPHLHFQVCDAPSGISCAGIPPTLTNVEIPAADGPRPIQSGDLVRPRQ